MSSASWDEIKRLAADFQRAQLSATSQKLSERNCVEIVRILQDLKLVNLIYTLDGKEYLTHAELGKEIKEELIALGGRVNLVDLQTALNIDLSHIEAKVAEIVGSEPDLMLVLGQLIDRSYIDQIADEINDKLQLHGRITIAELTIEYDLPGEFMAQAVSHRLGTQIMGQTDTHDPRLIYTQAFLSRHQCIVYGALSACTRPIQLSSIQSQYDLQPNLIVSIATSLIASKELNGVLTGGISGQFVPSVFTAAQQRWVSEFFMQNEYLEYDAVKRLGILDPESYVRKQFKAKGEACLYTPTCVLSSKYGDLVEAEIDEALANDTWSDVSVVLPTILSNEDVGTILSNQIRARTPATNQKPAFSALQFDDVYVVCSNMLDACAVTFDRVIKVKAEEQAKKKPCNVVSEKQTLKDIAAQEGGVLSKEERKEMRKKKATGGNKSQGSNAREVKMKSTKKKGRGNKTEDYERSADIDEDDDTFMTRSQLIEHMQNISPEDIEVDVKEGGSAVEEVAPPIVEMLQECPLELLACIAASIQPRLQEKYVEVAKSVYLQTLSASAASSGGAGSTQKTHSMISEEITTLWKNANLFEKSITLLDEESAVALNRHILRTVCTEITNIAFVELAGEHLIYDSSDLSSVTTEMRTKALSKVADVNMRSALMKLHTCVNGKSLVDFMTCLDVICGSEYLSIMLRKNDKKKEKQLLLSFREEMKGKLTLETNLATCLHLSVVLLIIHHFNMVLHAPGKCVPQMLDLLRGKVSKEEYGDLLECQGLVMKSLREPDVDISEEVDPLLTKMKAFSLSPKKA